MQLTNLKRKMIEISYECKHTNSIFQAFLSDYMFVSWIDCLIDGLLIKKRDHPYLDGNTILISVVTHYQRVLLTVMCVFSVTGTTLVYYHPSTTLML